MILEQLVGHHLMIGISGDRVNPETLRIFRETHAVGLILFRPNFKSASGFKKLLTELEEKLHRKLLVAVDHEGGRVIHLAEGVTVFPDNWAIGNTGKIDYARKQGTIEARELRRLGIDINLAPTLDVLTKNFSPNIGIRSYGHDPQLVARMGAARIQAMQKHGLSACAKHFPGLGASTLDPHLDLPTLDMTWQELRKIHLKPFLSAIQAGVDCVMSSHPVYPKLDASKAPATFSKKIIYDFLRQELQLKGVIFSDDLEMGALRGLCPIGESAVRAVEAGHDMVLLCHDPKAQRQASQALIQAYQTGRLSLASLEASAARIQRLMAKRSRRFESGAARPEKAGARVAEAMARQGIRSSHVIPALAKNQRSPCPTDGRRASRRVSPVVGGKAGIQSSLDSRFRGNDKRSKLLVLFPRLSDLAKKFYIEKEMLEGRAYAESILKRNRIPFGGIELVSLNPSSEEVKKLLSEIKKAERVLFFCYDAHLFPGARKILETVSKKSANAAILLRDPYDAEYIQGKIPFATAYGFRKVQIEAAVKKIKRFL